MSTQQLRNLLIDKISGIRDEKYLMALNTILEGYSGDLAPYKLSEEQKKEVFLGLEQIERGEVISNEDLEKEEDEWLMD